MTDTRKYFEKMVIELYCQDMITKEEAKERLIQKEKTDRKKSIERYLDLYLEGHITKEDLIDTLCE